ncbi:MAG: phosphoribosyltransferase [Acidobacteriota bacterium]
MLFQDRKDAGRKLAEMLSSLPHLADTVVLGLTRGGVPVAYEVARACHLPLDILVVRKLGAPGQRELAVGAVARGVVTLNPEIVCALRLSEEWLQQAAEHASAEIANLETLYRGGYPPIETTGRTVILVDDGLATGASMRAAARAVRTHAREVVIAVPVAAASTCRALESEADRIVCLASPGNFEAVGQFYRNFEATANDEVRDLLADARRQSANPAA